MPREAKEVIRDLHGYLDKDWHKSEEIVGLLNWMYKSEGKPLMKDDRELRDIFRQNNEMFIKGETELYLAHSNSGGVMGYKLTCDKDEILKSIADNYSRGISQMRLYYGVKKRLSEMDQLSLEPKEVQMYDLIKTMES